jgi:mono/diheme cytochrome c family protein
MKYSRKTLSASLAALTLCSGAAFAQAGKTDFGRDEYNANCAVCHGVTAKGNGPYMEMLRREPTDLTTLAKRNGGVLPVNRLYETIEGANVPSHGSRDMPIWGNAFRAQARSQYLGASDDHEVYVRSRILTLIDYINRIQVY